TRHAGTPAGRSSPIRPMRPTARSTTDSPGSTPSSRSQMGLSPPDTTMPRTFRAGHARRVEPGDSQLRPESRFRGLHAGPAGVPDAAAQDRPRARAAVTVTKTPAVGVRVGLLQGS